MSADFEIEPDGETLVVPPPANLGELVFSEGGASASAILSRLSDPGVKNLVLDFHRADYFGTTALGFFVRLWKRARERGGHMAVCNLSGRAREILHLTKMDGLWTVTGSRAEALRAVAGPT